MKKQVFVGNWKMYKTGAEASQFIKQFLPLVEKAKANIGLAVPFTALESAVKAVKAVKDSNVTVGAQNMNDAREGAFTGEIAASMIKDSGATFVILGHSERRQIFQETDEMINAKLKRALAEGLTPILCVGETEAQRESGHEKVLEAQIHEGLAGIDKEDLEKVIIAYEPVWAIGTGKTATPKMANDTHKHIRSVLDESYGKMRAKKVPLLYGGSVKPDNIAKLMKESEINGALVGGASLNPRSFSEIINHK